MKILKIFIPGEFEDAYLYMGRLVAFSSDGSLQFVDLNSLAVHLDSTLPRSQPIAGMLFARNDWTSGEQFQAFVKNPEIAAAIFKAVEAFPQPHVQVTLEDILLTRLDWNPKYSFVFDLHIYNERIYLATDQGLHHIDVHWPTRGEPQLVGESVTRLNGARCISTAARYGSVNVSCGPDGLYSATNEFRVDSEEEGAPEPQRIADRSLHCEWCSYDLVNYDSRQRMQLLRSTKEERRFREDETLITSLGQERTNLDFIFGVPEEELDFTFNWGKLFYAYTYEGALLERRISYKDQAQPKPQKLNRYDRRGLGRILKSRQTRQGLLVETYSQVSLVNLQGITSLLDEEVLSARAFARSKRYRDLVTITTESGIWLISLFDESKLNARNNPFG